MSTPAENAATQEDTEEKTATFAEAVSDAVNKATVDDKGNVVLPDELSEEVKYAATLEKRRRDTQAEYTRLSQKTKALEAEKSVLLKKATGAVKLELTAEQTEELEDLKFSDPEAWRKKMNQYEGLAQEKHAKELDEEVKKVSTSSLEQQEIERRDSVLKEFLKTHEGFDLNDDVIANDIPPRITKKLADGKVTFEQFLQECYDYTKTGKVIKQGEDTLGQPNLSKVGGGNRPDPNAVKEDIITSYNKETY